MFHPEYAEGRGHTRGELRERRKRQRRIKRLKGQLT
jgi:hypothetical protein